MSLNSLQQHVSRVKIEWEKFMQGEEVDRTVVSNVIKRSWVRSRAYGVDPDGPRLLSSTSEGDGTSEMSQLTSMNVNFAKLLSSDSSQYRIQLYDSAGFPLMNTRSNTQALEKRIGTNSIWLALTQDRVTSVLGYEHYRSTFHNTYGAAAPVHGLTGKVIGVVNVVCDDIDLAHNIAPMVTQFAGVLEVALSLLNGTESERQSPLEIFFHQFPQGIAWFDQDKLVRYNQRILDMLHISGKKNIPIVLEQQLSSWLSGRCLNRKPVSMDIAGQQTDFYFTAMPIATGGGKQRFLLLEKKEQINRQKPLHQSNELIQFSDIIGESRLLIAAKNTARRIADAQEPVLIVGESGTGKELFAQAIHRASPRRNGKFVPINCGAIPSELAESELFGYEAGAFTGALRNGKQGLLESASDGTIFLDEIESMPLFIQVKLLRAISTGSIVKVGSTKEMPINIRVISATKKDLLKEADLGTFREDLYYRISTFIIDLPPLQKRDDDVILLAKHFIKRCQEKYNKYPLTVDDDFWHALASYDWRGNIRELENVIGRVVYMADTEKLTIVTLPREVRESFTRASSGEVQYQAQVDGLLQTGEEKIIEAALLDTNYNISQASQLLGISRKTLYNRINNSERLTQLKSVHTKKTVAKKNCL